MHPWLRLLRLPNWLTVPGEPVVGLFLAGGTSCGTGTRAVASVLLLYGAGMVLNDVADVAIDRKERPDRPLPSGRIPVAQAALLGAALFLAGLGCAISVGLPAFLAAVALAVTILAYTFVRPLRDNAGPLLLGLCRAQAVMVGLMAAGGGFAAGSVLCVMAATLAYVMCFSRCARREMEADAVPFLDPWWPMLSFGLGFAVYNQLQPAAGGKAWLAGLLMALAAIFFASRAAKAFVRREQRIPAVGMWIGALLWMQGAWLAPLLPATWVTGLPALIAGVWLLMQAAGRKAPSS